MLDDFSLPDEEIGGELGMGKFLEHSLFKELNVGMALDEGKVLNT